MRKLLRLLLVASVLYGTGAHWVALQSAAWASMIAARAGESSLAEVVSSTFSGEKPCRMCRIVEKGAKAEQGPSILRSSPGLDLAVSAVSDPRAVLPARTPAVLSSPFGASRPSRPVVPPPKTVLPA
ncbi:MAG: hypothetical protein HYV14_10230 [Elusimicrobia bacterium]|nr:hypothetical protein [Elusimicrobiota bacterium]